LAGSPARAQSRKDCIDELRGDCGSQTWADLSNVEETVIRPPIQTGSSRKKSPLTLEEVGQIIGVTKERVRQIQNKALMKIRGRTRRPVCCGQSRAPSTNPAD